MNGSQQRCSDDNNKNTINFYSAFLDAQNNSDGNLLNFSVTFQREMFLILFFLFHLNFILPGLSRESWPRVSNKYNTEKCPVQRKLNNFPIELIFIG